MCFIQEKAIVSLDALPRSSELLVAKKPLRRMDSIELEQLFVFILLTYKSNMS